MKRDPLFSFTAYNIETGKTESFQARKIHGIHDSFMDAARSHLWFGHCWDREQLKTARIKIHY